ncbi:MAG: imidazolonepropionase [Cyclobacteriaceae bacterium]
MMNKAGKYRLIGPFTQLLTLEGTPERGALTDNQLSVIHDGGLLLLDNEIFATGRYNELLATAQSLNAEITEIKDERIAMPGMIDAHTHICFGGSRAADYAMRNAGMSYLEIAKKGGGIWDTVTETRKSTKQELVAGTMHRLASLLRSGITTVEIKSGYGLSVDEELKMLRAIKEANRQSVQDLVPTCLAAHILPKDFNGDHQAYLREISENVFPLLKSEGLASRVDAFVEQSAYSAENILPYLTKAHEMGFDITIHADQFTPGGTALAVELEAISADHLEASTDKEIEILAKSEVIATALPGASIGLGCAFTPARKLLDAGCAVAIASDWNPGSAPMGDLLIQANILATFEKLTNAEVLAGITKRAAAALGMNDRGVLKKSAKADFVVFNTSHFNEICYRQGMLKPSQVWKDGIQVVDMGKIIEKS